MKTAVGARIIGAAFVAFAAATASSQGPDAKASLRPSEPLKAYLRSYLSRGGKITPDHTTRIAVFSLEIKNGKSKEEIVYVSGRDWCGSGGCTMLILGSNESEFKVLGRVTIVQLPITLLPTLHYGHPDIGVRVQGGGILPGYEAVLSFNGTKYPSNPSVPPAKKIVGAKGKVIIANLETTVSLYD